MPNLSGCDVEERIERTVTGNPQTLAQLFVFVCPDRREIGTFRGRILPIQFQRVRLSRYQLAGALCQKSIVQQQAIHRGRLRLTKFLSNRNELRFHRRMEFPVVVKPPLLELGLQHTIVGQLRQIHTLEVRREQLAIGSSQLQTRLEKFPVLARSLFQLVALNTILFVGLQFIMEHQVLGSHPQSNPNMIFPDIKNDIGQRDWMRNCLEAAGKHTRQQQSAGNFRIAANSVHLFHRGQPLRKTQPSPAHRYRLIGHRP